MDTQSYTFSVTERETFKRCRRLWYYTSANLLSLGSVAPQKALSLGSVIHRAMAEWLQAPETPLAELFVLQATAEREKIKAAYKAKVGANISEEELAPFTDGVELGTAMCRNYQQKWLTPLFDGFELLQPEMKIVVPVPGSPHRLSLRLDALIRRTRDGTLLILDHKTYSSRPRLPSLQMNDQFLAYQWAVQRTALVDNPAQVIGTAYDGMWKRAAPPRGSAFDDLFTRVIITRPQFEVDAFGAQLAAELDEMGALVDEFNNQGPSQTSRMEYFYPNRRWEGCYDDGSFETLCTLQSRGEDHLHYMETHYQRLTVDKEAVMEND